ncbi:MAG: hypothetical protein AB9M60_05625 [Leptothrix sp. (in: b-proteobacteria)]
MKKSLVITLTNPAPVEPRTPAGTAVAMAADLRGGLAAFLGSVYIVVLIPMILGLHGSGGAATSLPATALACAVGTALYALGTRLPFTVGPGIVPASIVVTFLASGIAWPVVMGIEVVAGLLFLVLVATGALRVWVQRTPPALKTAGQLAIGLYLLLAALRVTGIYPLQEGAAMSAAGWPGLLFLAGLVAVLLLHHTKRWGGHAVLLGILLATAGAAMLGLVDLPGLAFQSPTLEFALPDVAAALSLRYLDEMLVLLYVVVVDVVATLETIAACSPEMRGADGRLRDFDRGLGMSAVVFLASPLLGMPPMLVFFESLGGVMSGARSWRAAALGAAGFGVMIFAAPLAHAIPPFACAVALGYIGYAITQHAVEALPGPSDPVEASLGRRLASLAVIVMIVTNSVALTLFGLFVMYPVTIVMAGRSPRGGDLIAAATCAALIGLMFW